MHLRAIQSFPGSFPDFSRSSLDFPGSSPDLPRGQPLSLGSLTPSDDSQKVPLTYKRFAHAMRRVRQHWRNKCRTHDSWQDESCTTPNRLPQTHLADCCDSELFVAHDSGSVSFFLPKAFLVFGLSGPSARVESRDTEIVCVVRTSCSKPFTFTATQSNLSQAQSSEPCPFCNAYAN